MIRQLLKKKDLHIERTYPAPVEAVWQALTQPEALQQWWGPEKTSVPVCTVDLSLGGEIHLVMEAGEEMGKYAGTRWPMAGTFTRIEAPTRLTYEARSWTEGEDGTTIEHVNDLSLTEVDGTTTLRLDVAITEIGEKAKMAAFGMKWGYKAGLDELEAYLAGD